jgi:pimeloyl-ACP methyl ester carboxylesterase
VRRRHRLAWTELKLRPYSLRPYSRIVRCTALLALVMMTALLVGARCYPAGTRVVVFMQGYYTTYDASGTQPTIVEGQRFNVLKNKFGVKGYARTALLDFSYAGGVVAADGSWRPAPYSCEMTDRPSDQNLTPLEKMLSDYRSHHKDAHFALVGHSLGGYLAFVEGAREAVRANDAKLGIDVVVTLDAPLQGASADKKLVLDIVQCNKTYLAGAEIVQQKLDPTTPGIRAEQTRMMAEQGIRLATYGNMLDCFWNPAVCVPALPWVDDSATQLLPGASVSQMYNVASVPLASHDAILADAGVGTDVVQFVGAP